MINFTKILQKAAAEPGRSTGVATLMMGVAHAGVAEAARPAPGAAPSDLLEAPPARESAPSADAGGEGLVTDELVRSALEAMFPDAAATEGEVTSPKAGADGHAEGDDSAAVAAALEAQAAGAPAPMAPEDSEKAIDDMLKDAFAAATAEDSASAAGEPQIAATPPASEPDAESVSETADEESATQIDDTFMAEIDRLLNEFGQMGGETPAEQDADEVAVNDLSMEALDALESSKALEMAQDAVPSVEDAFADAPEAGSAGAESGPAEPAAKAERIAAAFESEPAEPAAKAEEPAAPESAAPAAEAASTPAAEAKSPKSAEPAQGGTLTQEEKDALFAETAEGGAAAGEAEESDALEIAGQAGEPPQAAEAAEPVGPAELELDFTPDGVGVEEPAESPTASVDTEDLLSKVLSDLDRLGDVDKPTKDAQGDEGEKEKDEAEDFTQILTELDTEAQSQADGGPAADSPQPVDVAPASQSEEDIISDALQAADEVEAEIVKDEPPAKGKAGKDADKKGAKKDKDSAKDKKADGAKAGKDKPGGGKAKPEDEEAEGEAAAEEAPAVENEASLLANLEASMAAASPEEEDEKGDGSEEAAEKKSEDDEEAVRDEVLSRTKEVEQKVLDDAFGSNTKEFREEMKSEMAQAGKDEKKPGDKKSALASESARLAAGGPKAAAAAASPEKPKVEQAAPAALTFSPKDLDWFLWVAYQLNRPFLRWLNPERRALVGSLSIALILAAVIWAVVAFLMFWFHV